ncbi:hypothetical protein D3C75_241890 [compost metagenome]
MDSNYVSGSQRNLSKAIYPEFVENGVFWLSNNDLEYLDKHNCVGEYTSNGRYYRSINYNLEFCCIVGQMGEKIELTDSRTHLFSITNLSFWTYQNRRLEY